MKASHYSVRFAPMDREGLRAGREYYVVIPIAGLGLIISGLEILSPDSTRAEGDCQKTLSAMEYLREMYTREREDQCKNQQS